MPIFFLRLTINLLGVFLILSAVLTGFPFNGTYDKIEDHIFSVSP